MATRLKVEMLTEIPVGQKMFNGDVYTANMWAKSFRVPCKITFVLLHTLLSYIMLKSEMNKH